MKLIDKKMVDGLDLDSSKKLKWSQPVVCEPCLAEKQTRDPFVSRV